MCVVVIVLVVAIVVVVVVVVALAMYDVVNDVDIVVTMQAMSRRSRGHESQAFPHT